MLGVSVDAAARRPRLHQAPCPFCPFVSTIDLSDVDPSAVSAVVHARCGKCARRFSFRNPKYGGLREAGACSGCSAAPAAPAAPASPVRTDPPPVTRPPPKGVGAVGDFAGDVAVRARETIRPSTLEVPDDAQASPTSAAVLVGGARHSGGDGGGGGGGGGGGDEDRPRQKQKQKPRRANGSPELRRPGGSLGERQSLGDGGAGGGGAGAAACACAVPAPRERLPQVDPPPRPRPRLCSRSRHPLARSDGLTQHHLVPTQAQPTVPTVPTTPTLRRRRRTLAPPRATPARPTLTRLAPRYGRRNAARSASCRGQSGTTAAVVVSRATAAPAAVERCGPWRRR